MREIKFRGYDLDTKRWYYGSYVRLERSTPYPMSPDPEGDAKKFEAEQVDHYIFFTEDNDWGLATRKLKVTVDPKSVGQYTGLKDKNGVEIYEGDILKDGTLMTFVEFDEVGIYDSDGAFYSWGYSTTFNRPQECEVIGNIYESPELLK